MTTSRQRVYAAMRHEQPDRVPLFYRDVPEVRERLMRDLHCHDLEALLRLLEIDFRWVEPEYVGPPLIDNERPDRRRDIWSVEYRYVKFSESAGYWEVADHPLKNAETPADLEGYCWPQLDWFDFTTMPDQVARYEGYAIMTAPGVASPSLLQSPMQTLLGDSKSLMDMAANPALIAALSEAILGFQLPFIEKMLASAGGRIDFFRIGDDYGTQRGLLISPATYREHFQSSLKAMAEVARRHGAFYYHHTCGAVRQLIPDLIDTGIDVLDPIQVKAADMDPGELKAEFGDKLCFSGGVDEQDLLPHGTPEDVRRGVRDLCDAMAPGGGFFIGPTHNFQDDIPTENIVALYEAAREWR